MANSDNLDGVWRTIGGRRVFIKNGQDLASAMKESGKFGGKYDNDITIKRIMEVIEKQTQLEKELQEISNQAYNEMTEQEVETMNFYTSDGYFDINDYLSGKYDLENGQEIVNNINNAISKFNYNENFSVYSGTSKSHYRNYKKDDIIETNRFISSSTNQSVAGIFAESEENGLIMKINVKQNSKGMYIGVGSSMFSESEFLLSNEQKYKVVGRSAMEINNKKYEVLEVDTYG